MRLESHYGNINAIRNPIQEELISKLEEENKALVEEVERTKKDQEELLELLAEQDKRIYEYRVQLRNLGVDVSLQVNAMFIRSPKKLFNHKHVLLVIDSTR